MKVFFAFLSLAALASPALADPVTPLACYVGVNSVFSNYSLPNFQACVTFNVTCGATDAPYCLTGETSEKIIYRGGNTTICDSELPANATDVSCCYADNCNLPPVEFNAGSEHLCLVTNDESGAVEPVVLGSGIICIRFQETDGQTVYTHGTEVDCYYYNGIYGIDNVFCCRGSLCNTAAVTTTNEEDGTFTQTTTATATATPASAAFVNGINGLEAMMVSIMSLFFGLFL